MKINGIAVKIERETIIPILSKKDQFYLIGKPIASYEPFDELCERPQPRMGGEPGKERPMIEAREYREALTAYSRKFNAWLVVATLVEVADESGKRYPMEWDTVKVDEPDTLEKWEEELREINGLSEADIQRVMMEVMRCNQMDEQMIEAAKDHFLAITEGQDSE